jgi:hypothetical protein
MIHFTPFSICALPCAVLLGCALLGRICSIVALPLFHAAGCHSAGAGAIGFLVYIVHQGGYAEFGCVQGC